MDTPHASTTRPASAGRTAQDTTDAASNARSDVLARIRRLESGGLRTFVTPDPLVVDRGEGAWLYGPDGRAYLDLAGSFAVTTTGHCHPKVVAAIKAQAERLIHCPSAYPSALRADFLEAIEAICAPLFGAVSIMPAMTGAMANEMALRTRKTAPKVLERLRRWAFSRRNSIVCPFFWRG